MGRLSGAETCPFDQMGDNDDSEKAGRARDKKYEGNECSLHGQTGVEAPNK